MKRFLPIIAAASACIFFTACENKQENSEITETDASSVVTDIPEATTEATEPPTEEPTVPETEPIINAEKIELSGDPNDVFTAETDCYAENENIVMYFQKDVTIKGDMLETANKVMNDLSEITGFDFSSNCDTEHDFSFVADMYFEPDYFSGVNPNESKVNIFVVDLGDAVEFTYVNSAAFFSSDFDYEYDFYSVLYHELSHVLQFRNGVDLGNVMNEGFAAYTENKARLSNDIPAWTAAQYYFPLEFDDSIISGNDEDFTYLFDVNDNNYQYGFRFVTFLNETYGEDIFYDILSKATETGFDSGYDVDNYEASVKKKSVELLAIIKSVTSENVMVEFSEWYNANWSLLAQKYMERVEAMS